VPLADYLDVIRRRWLLVLLTAVVAVVAAVAVARTQTPVYRSSIRLEVTGRVDYGQVLAMDRLVRQIAARVKTSPVAEAAAERLNLGISGEAVLAKLQAQAYPDVLHIQVDVDDESPERAAKIAAVVGEVVQEQQAARMATIPQQERINLAVLDRASAGRLVWPQTRQMAMAAAVAGLAVGVLLAFTFHYAELRASKRSGSGRSSEPVTDIRPADTDRDPSFQLGQQSPGS